ncbi:hypothetical protein HYU13_03215, partial [Candidatus Woesearchaeota archaeon]|nr:hypothetical protein [Candidatus Woesearchaeota archaeon]
MKAKEKQYVSVVIGLIILGAIVALIYYKPSEQVIAITTTTTTLKAFYQVNVKFVNHLQAGLPEQDVFIVLNTTPSGLVSRAEVSDT